MKWWGKNLKSNKKEIDVEERIKDAINMGCKEDWEIISWLTAGGIPEDDAKKALHKFKKGGVESGGLSLGFNNVVSGKVKKSKRLPKLGRSRKGNKKDRNRNGFKRI